MSIVSNNIKYLRRLNGLTQEQFARRIGIKRSLLGAYEEARANPNLDNLMSIARAFHTTVDHLLKSDLRKIRETPDLSLPLPDDSAERPIAVPSPLAKELAEPNTPAPKPLAAVLEKYYQPPGSRPLPEPQRPASQPPAIKWVAQRVVPRPISQRDGFAPLPLPLPFDRPAQPQPPSFNNVFESNPAVSGRPAVERPVQEDNASPTSIQWVRQSQLAEYQQRYQQLDFLNRLPTLQLPLLPPGHYRAFEIGDDANLPGALLIGQFVRNWYEIADGKMYVLLVQPQGLLCRRIINQVKTKGSLLLTADQPSVPNREVPIRDVLEVWEVKAFVSQQLPAPAPSLDGLRKLVDDLRFELDRVQAR